MTRGWPILLAAMTSLAMPAAPAAAAFEIVDNMLKAESPVVFAADGAVPLPSSERELAHMRAFLADKPAISLVRIEAHVPGNDPARAQALSERRALAVARWLAAHGIDCRRIVPVGFGATKPLANGAEPANERVVLGIAALRGRLIGGQPADGGGRIAGDACR